VSDKMKFCQTQCRPLRYQVGAAQRWCDFD